MRAHDHDRYWFPGRWVGGISLLVAPLLLLTGIIARLPFHFFFPDQLAAAEAHPTRMFIAYSLVIAGTILLWPAIATLAHRIGRSHPRWASWGGTLVILGLFARTFHAGADHLAFAIVDVDGAAPATRVVAASYGRYHVVSALNPAILLGWIVLAIGAYRSRTLGLPRAIALGLMSALMLGVLKGSSATSVVATGGLAVALVPLGVTVLRDGPAPRPRSVLISAALILALAALFAFIGQAG